MIIAAHEETAEAIQKMKSGKTTGQSDVSVRIKFASDRIGVKAMMDMRWRMLYGRKMSGEWKISVSVIILKERLIW